MPAPSGSRNYTQADGLPHNNVTACTRDGEGNLWFTQRFTAVRHAEALELLPRALSALRQMGAAHVTGRTFHSPPFGELLYKTAPDTVST